MAEIDYTKYDIDIIKIILRIRKLIKYYGANSDTLNKLYILYSSWEKTPDDVDCIVLVKKELNKLEGNLDGKVYT